MTTRKDHMDWCKKRAIEYIDSGDSQQAYTSMISDLGKHPETEGHSGMQLGMMMLISGLLGTPSEMREFVNGFH